jgi:hypothetical protein
MSRLATIAKMLPIGGGKMKALLFAVIVMVTMTVCESKPALADGPVGVVAGAAFPQGSIYSRGSAQVYVGASYDVGPKFGPFRGSILFDYASGAIDNHNLNDYAFGVGVRLTTPLYAGLSVGVGTTNANQTCPTPEGGFASPICPGLSATGFASTYFVGVRLISVPGITLSLQGGYRQMPTLDGVNASGASVGLRLQI